MKCQKLCMLGLLSVALYGCNSSKNNELLNFEIATKLPEAPLGYEWQLVENMSDEFNDDEFDKTKWQDHIKTWQGRPPAEFLPQNISEKDGTLRLKTSTHPNPNETYTMGGAAVKGLHEMRYGYYEARIKASKARMSTTFWLHSDTHEDRELGCGKHHAIELDILEAIGGWYTEDWTHVMHSNTHYKPTKRNESGRCVGDKYLSKGVKKHTGFDLSEDFHTFSLWWATPNQMTYYFNGESIGTVNLDHERDPLAFDGVMSLRMVVETYTWQETLGKKLGKPAYPTDSELDDSLINTAFYDYVRSYRLVPTASNLMPYGDFEQSADISHWQWQGAQISKAPRHSATHDNGLLVAPNSRTDAKVKIQKGRYLLAVNARQVVSDGKSYIKVVNETGDLLADTEVTTEDFTSFKLEFESTYEQEISVIVQNEGEASSVFDTFALLAN